MTKHLGSIFERMCFFDGIRLWQMPDHPRLKASFTNQRLTLWGLSAEERHQDGRAAGLQKLLVPPPPPPCPTSSQTNP